MERSSFLTPLISWCFLFYFLILFAERLQSLVRTLSSGESLFRTGFDAFVNLAALLSLLGAAILLAFFNQDFWKSLFSASVLPDYKMLCVTSGVILVSGMVHTEFTAAPVQFVSYGFLILGLILQTVLNVKAGGDPFRHWYSLLYLTAFSMAIPVMYRSFLRQSALFHVLEAVTALVLVAFFTLLLTFVFTGRGADLLLWIPLVVMAGLDLVLLTLRWREEVNTFVLVFSSASLVIFLTGKILFALKK